MVMLVMETPVLFGAALAEEGVPKTTMSTSVTRGAVPSQ
jgi:hypothetical protein